LCAIFIMKKYILILSFSAISFTLMAQVGYGIVASNDLYQWYKNPDDGISDPTHGNAILNLSVGPKIWVGGKKFSFSVEGQANMGFTGFTIGENKGYGAVAFPIIGSLNFGGLSTFDREGKAGFSLGGGIQYNKTELYGLRDEFVDLGVTRDYFRTIIVQAVGGFGVSGFALSGVLRFGFDPDTDAASFNFGIQYDFNRPMMKKIDDPNSAL